MALHFPPEELAERRAHTCRHLAKEGLDGLLMFRQESMFYLTGYDTFGYVFFQCLFLGADGRMGQTLVRTVVAAEACELIGAISKHDSPALGMDAGMVAGLDPCGVRIGEDPVPLFADADAVIDFTVPEATVGYAALAAQGKTVHVIGTTGLDSGQRGCRILTALAEERHSAGALLANVFKALEDLIVLHRAIVVGTVAVTVAQTAPGQEHPAVVP